MRRAPELERHQAPEEVRALCAVIEQLPGAPRLISKVLARSRPGYGCSIGRSVGLTHEAPAARLPSRPPIELALTVAAASFSHRLNAALTVDLEHSQP
jgi:hypothetical protein